MPALPPRSSTKQDSPRRLRATKPTIRSICVREEDAQGTAGRHPGQEHLPEAR
jgi:hypothetical protein